MLMDDYKQLASLPFSSTLSVRHSHYDWQNIAAKDIAVKNIVTKNIATSRTTTALKSPLVVDGSV